MSRLSACLLAIAGLIFSPALSLANEPPATDVKRTPRPEELKPSAGAVTRLGKARHLNVGKVFSVAFSPDGKILAAGAWDGSIRLWDVATSKELRQCVGHTGWIKALAFSPDGQMLASAGKDRDIRAWTTATGQELRRLNGQGPIQSLVFSPDGKFLASQSQAGTLLVWDARSGRVIGHLPAKAYAGYSLAFSPDSKLLAYASDNETISLWELAQAKESRGLKLPRSWFHAIAFSPDGKTLTAVSSSRAIHLWDVNTGKELRPLATLATETVNLAFSPDGRALAFIGGDSALHVWELRTRQERCRFRPPESKLQSLAFSPDGKLLALGGNDITVLLWDLTGRMHQGELQPIVLTPEELPPLWADLAAADASKANCAIWKLVAAPQQTVAFLKEHLHPVAYVDVPELTQLVTDLESDRFATRKKATQQLEQLGESAESGLRKALAKQPPLETRRRLEQLLEKIDRAKQGLTPESMRGLRAVGVLEHIGTVPARQLLAGLAEGSAEALLTQDAKASLQRLARRP
jgi:roadblock/LC7 domain-containing protein